MLGRIAEPEQDRLVSAMRTIETLMDGGAEDSSRPSCCANQATAISELIVARHAHPLRPGIRLD